MTTTAGLRLVRWTDKDFNRNLTEVMSVYAEAMEYPQSVAESRRGFVASHAHRDDFRAVATLDTAGRLAGFSYGYHSMQGQWWHQQVRAGLLAENRQDDCDMWFADAYELVELHIRPAFQGRGLGQDQLVALLDGVQHRTVLLSTPEGESRAWKLYRRMGFVDVLRYYYFPGDERPFGVLGRGLPLDVPATSDRGDASDQGTEGPGR